MHSPSSVTADISGTQTCTQVLWGCAVQYFNHKAVFPFSPALLPALLLFPSMEKSPLSPRLGTHQYRLFALLDFSPSSDLLPTHLVSAEHEQQKRNGDCPLHILADFFPLHTALAAFDQIAFCLRFWPHSVVSGLEKGRSWIFYFWELSPLLWILKIIKL